MLKATVYDQDDNPILAGIRLDVDLIRRNIIGGDDFAEIRTIGPNDALWNTLTWLGYTVAVFAPDGGVCWRGKIVEATAPHGNAQLGLSLRGMCNRVAVAYTVNSERRTTAWAQDDDSVRRFGRSELLVSISNVTDEQALAERNKKLAELKDPRRINRSGSGANGLLICEGAMHDLDRVYYANPKGRIVNSAPETKMNLLAWGITDSPLIGIADKQVQSFGYDLAALSRDDRLSLSTSSGETADGTYTVGGAAEGSAVDQVTNATIHFEADDDIYDDLGKALGFIKQGRAIQITCTPGNVNDGYWLAETAARGAVTLELSWNGRAMVLDNTPGTVNIKMAQSVKLDTETIPNYVMDVSRLTTLRVEGSGGIADAFTLPTSDGWTLAEVVLELRREGTPPDLTVQICSNAGGIPGTVLGATTIAAASVEGDVKKVTAAFATPVALSPSATYWIVVKPGTSSLTPIDYYEIKLGKLPVTGNVLRTTTGATWVQPNPRMTLFYELWGNVETTAQIEDIATQEGDTLTAVDIRKGSDVDTRQYRNGDKTAWAEITKLLDAQTADGTRLIVEITGGTLVIKAEPTLAENWLTFKEGKLYNRLGARLPVGILPVGEWVYLDIPEEINRIVGISPYQIGSAEYDAATDSIRLDPVVLSGTKEG